MSQLTEIKETLSLLNSIVNLEELEKAYKQFLSDYKQSNKKNYED